MDSFHHRGVGLPNWRQDCQHADCPRTGGGVRKSGGDFGCTCPGRFNCALSQGAEWRWKRQK